MSLTITVISGLYQKIDPKVREARRKKFFGSGRRKRDAKDEEKEEHKIGNLEEDLLLEVFGAKDLEEGGHNADGSRRGRAKGLMPQNSESRFHAFHSCKKCHLCHPDCQRLALFPFFIPVEGQFFRGQCGTVGQGRIANETAIGSENREVHLSGPFIRVGVHGYRRCTEGINSLVGRLNKCIHHPYGHEHEHHYH